MCAILGGNNPNWKYKDAIMSMQHRGPDSVRTYFDGEITMAFARLSIIDLSETAMQPMSSYDNNVYITFNGEIYNHMTIRTDLEKMGYRFRTNCDTEVILNGYLEYGLNSLLDKIEGMFAFAIYDKRIKRIYLIRDRVGIKPLFYYYDGNDLAYSSELKGITNLIDRSFEIDNTAIYDYLTYQYIPRPKTLYKNIFKQEPGTVVEYSLNSRTIKVKTYWELKPNEAQSRVVTDYGQLFENIRGIIKKNVNMQLVADVPVGVFLSGGIDSSIIAKTTKEFKPNVHSFSIDFTRRRLSERAYVDKAIESTGMEGHIFLVKNSDILELYESIIEWFDEPFADIGAFPSFILSNKTRDYVTVALSGDGGDELFAGYSRHFMHIKARASVPSDIDTDLELISSTLSVMKKRDKMVFKEFIGIPRDYDDYWFFRKFYNLELPPITRLQYLDFKTYLPESVLTKTDRTSMQASLEVRVPFLNRELIEFVFGLHEQDRCGNGDTTKYLLKETFSGELPDSILYREKKGFNSPGFENEPFPQRQLYKDLWEKYIYEFR